MRISHCPFFNLNLTNYNPLSIASLFNTHPYIAFKTQAAEHAIRSLLVRFKQSFLIVMLILGQVFIALLVATCLPIFYAMTTTFGVSLLIILVQAIVLSLPYLLLQPLIQPTLLQAWILPLPIAKRLEVAAQFAVAMRYVKPLALMYVAIMLIVMTWAKKWQWQFAPKLFLLVVLTLLIVMMISTLFGLFWGACLSTLPAIKTRYLTAYYRQINSISFYKKPHDDGFKVSKKHPFFLQIYTLFIIYLWRHADPILYKVVLLCAASCGAFASWAFYLNDATIARNLALIAANMLLLLHIERLTAATWLQQIALQNNDQQWAIDYKKIRITRYIWAALPMIFNLLMFSFCAYKGVLSFDKIGAYWLVVLGIYAALSNILKPATRERAGLILVSIFLLSTIAMS